jgi:hypothetical protein
MVFGTGLLSGGVVLLNGNVPADKYNYQRDYCKVVPSVLEYLL